MLLSGSTVIYAIWAACLVSLLNAAGKGGFEEVFFQAIGTAFMSFLVTILALPKYGATLSQTVLLFASVVVLQVVAITLVFNKKICHRRCKDWLVQPTVSVGMGVASAAAMYAVFLVSTLLGLSWLWSMILTVALAGPLVYVTFIGVVAGAVVINV